MRGRRFQTEDDIKRHISNGFGSGAGASYEPWLRVQDVPSRGRSHKIYGVKVDRLHHLFSDLERAYLLLWEFSESVVDIREQYPLLPRESAQAVATSIGVRYPRYPKTTVPYVMTTDFLLTVKCPDGRFETVARTVKYSSDFIGNSALRTYEKLEVEKRFWNAQGVDWSVVTELGFSDVFIKNLGLLRKYAQLPRALAQPELLSKFVSELIASRPYPWSTAECLRKIASRLFISYQDARYIYLYLIWSKTIKIDLVTQPIMMSKPLTDFDVAVCDHEEIKVIERGHVRASQ
ncbi:TnsA endonuclease N-terminal domain-containing protein [Pseudomonas hunanensis]|uniref:TnsA endonuclease N-terminal domain-containing protein n=1 Tax=Pseudomonas hunanensis TaxID=1247546 RepID=UPI0037F8108E